MPKLKQPFPKQALARSVQEFPTSSEGTPGMTLTMQFAAADNIVSPWGFNVRRRDEQLRDFAMSENMLQSAIYSVSARNAAFQWDIEAAPATRDALEYMLNNFIVGGGRGWIPAMMALTQDFVGTDNGMAIEIIRDIQKKHKGREWTAPVIGLAHLDGNACQRTGDPEIPVIYFDLEGNRHKMPWWSISINAEMPSADQKMYGVGISAVTRVLRAANILKSIGQFKDEKVGGRFIKSIHFVSGVDRKRIEDIEERDQEHADNMGLVKYIKPLIIAGLDPQNPVTTATLNLAELPEGFDFDSELKWYITQLALGFGVDYQDFAPLPGGNLGTSTQSEILHLKSRGKGPALWMRWLQDLFKWHGIFPRTANFVFSEQDLSAELEEARLEQTRAQTRATRIQFGEITPEVARLLAVEDGDLTEEQAAQVPDDYMGLPRADTGLNDKRESENEDNVETDKEYF